MSASSSAKPVSGPPYAPQAAQIGGIPTPGVDDPICAVLLLFFVASAATNMTIFRINLRRDHRFLFSAMLFGFSMLRILALVMRIVWASRPHNVSIAIAANIFTLAGVVILFMINLIFAQRMLRAYRPRIGWMRPVTYVFRFFFFSVIGVLVMMIPVTVNGYYTLSAHVLSITHTVQRVGSTYMASLAFLPLPIMLLTLCCPPRPPYHGPVENFGKGQLVTKLWLLLGTSTLLSLGAGLRAGASYAPRPLNNPAWYHSRASYYCFNFVIEITVVYVYTLTRFDRRFHVPNGASAPGHYSAGSSAASLEAGTGTGVGTGGIGLGEKLQRKRSLADRINAENDVFGYETEPPASSNNNYDHNSTHDNNTANRAKNWDAQAQEELRMASRGQAA